MNENQTPGYGANGYSQQNGPSNGYPQQNPGGYGYPQPDAFHPYGQQSYGQGSDAAQNYGPSNAYGQPYGQGSVNPQTNGYSQPYGQPGGYPQNYSQPGGYQQPYGYQPPYGQPNGYPVYDPANAGPMPNPKLYLFLLILGFCLGVVWGALSLTPYRRMKDSIEFGDSVDAHAQARKIVMFVGIGLAVNVVLFFMGFIS